MQPFHPACTDMPLDLLRDLISQGILSEECDPDHMTQADWDNYHADMAAMAFDVPTDDELEAMAAQAELSHAGLDATEIACVEAA